MNLIPSVPLPEDLLVGIRHEPLGGKILQRESRALQLPAHQVFHGFKGKVAANTHTLSKPFQNHRRRQGVITRRHGLRAQEYLRL